MNMKWNLFWKKYEAVFAGYARERGVELLGIHPAGCSPIFSTVPISGPDDLRDKKVMTPVTSRFLNRPSGENSIPLSFPEVASALNSGKVEVVFGPPAVVVIMGWYPYIRYAYMTCVSSTIGAFIFNSDRYQNLPEDIRSVSTEFLRKQQKMIRKQILRDNEIAMLGLMKRGVKIIQIPPEEMERRREATKPLWDSGVGKFYPRELLDNILRDLEAYRTANGFK
jgi:TRAP-type C4-dicarboxylate transport system substrate-binding protein